MRYALHGKTVFLQTGLLILLLSGAVLLEASGTTYSPFPKLILEVINRHFTMGRKIRSVYLRVFSDGTAECHTVKYDGKETDLVKKKTLSREDFESLRILIENPELPEAEGKYGLMSPVVDSWMEWDIKVRHHSRIQTIRILNFSPGSARERKQPYPDAVVKLGCSIWRLRNDIYGDEPSYGNEDCRRALGIE